MARKQQTGTVLKDKNDKSVIVGVSWLQRDRIYKKARRKLTKFVVHDENNSATVGDRVLIEESRPISKTKRWRLVNILDKVDEIHKPLFDAIHKHREPLFTPTALADFFAKYGVEEDEFNQLYSSFGVSTKLRQTDALARDYQIRGVPSFVVNGKYLILRDGLRNNQEMFDVIDFLVKKERR